MPHVNYTRNIYIPAASRSWWSPAPRRQQPGRACSEPWSGTCRTTTARGWPPIPRGASTPPPSAHASRQAAPGATGGSLVNEGEKNVHEAVGHQHSVGVSWSWDNTQTQLKELGPHTNNILQGEDGTTSNHRETEVTRTHAQGTHSMARARIARQNTPLCKGSTIVLLYWPFPLLNPSKRLLYCQARGTHPGCPWTAPPS